MCGTCAHPLWPQVSSDSSEGRVLFFFFCCFFKGGPVKEVREELGITYSSSCSSLKANARAILIRRAPSVRGLGAASPLQIPPNCPASRRDTESSSLMF